MGVKKFSYRPVVKSLDGNAGIEFQSNNNERMGLFYQGGGSGRFYFQEYSKTDGVLTNYYENYQLPQPDNNLTSNPTYNILTSKNPVTVTQGGTGATTVDGARENLNIFRSLGALTDANNTNLFGSTLRQANTCANLPTSAAGTYYFLMCFGNSQLALRFTSTGADRLYARYHTNSKWYDWKGVALS